MRTYNVVIADAADALNYAPACRHIRDNLEMLTEKTKHYPVLMDIGDDRYVLTCREEILRLVDSIETGLKNREVQMTRGEVLELIRKMRGRIDGIKGAFEALKEDLDYIDQDLDRLADETWQRQMSANKHKMPDEYRTLIQEVGNYLLTADDVREQRISYAYGTTKLENEYVTRDMVEKIDADKHKGNAVLIDSLVYCPQCGCKDSFITYTYTLTGDDSLGEGFVHKRYFCQHCGRVFEGNR